MYKCNCGKDFDRQRSLNSHARFCKSYTKTKKKSQYLDTDGLYKCECGRSFEKSQSLNSHFSRCLIHRNGNPPINNRGGGGWSKDLTKNDHPAILKMSKSLESVSKGKVGIPHTEETKKKMSLKRINFLEENPDSNIKWYLVNNGERDIKVQGMWEKNVADWLNKLKIKWDRHRISYEGHRTYTPDFWIPDYNFYIEVKGWLSNRDIDKMRNVIKETGIKIKILSKKEYLKLENLKIDDIFDFQ
jgi:hypothetical protein